MAGDWIKMRMDLTDDPAVIAMAAALKLDEYGVVGRLHKLWSWADKHCSAGHAKSVTNVWIDRHVEHAGFAQAMADAGWLTVSDAGIAFPNFDRHNGISAKVRAEAAERQRLSRARAAEAASAPDLAGESDLSQVPRDKAVTREEKKR
jgi:hypothetical protein